MDIGHYSIFLVTTVMLILVPGPAAIPVAAQGASHSSNKAFLGVLGVASADVVFFTLGWIKNTTHSTGAVLNVSSQRSFSRWRVA